MIFGQWFKELHKITYNSMKIWGSRQDLTNLVGVHPGNLHTKSEALLCSSLREVGFLKKHNNDNNNDD